MLCGLRDCRLSCFALQLVLLLFRGLPDALVSDRVLAQPPTAVARTAAESPSRADAEQHFLRQVLPVLKEKCFACHGDDPDDVKGEFTMLSRAGILRGGESGEAAIVPGNPDQSLVYQAIQWDGLEMPPKENDRLTEPQVNAIRQWIAAGAPWPDAVPEPSASPQSPAEEERVTEECAGESNQDQGIQIATSGGLSSDWTNRRYEAEDVWAYQPLRRVAIPEVVSSTDPPHPIDAFILRKLHAAGLAPAGPAPNTTLIRRLTFDLTGLPPTPDEVDAFVNDGSPQAYPRLVDRLLASDGYGEQMARHWLDVVRYADTSGFSNDFERPNAWRYRDYVVRSFTQDKPYDRFVTEQIAGDELDPDDPDCLIAVGFLRMGPWEHTAMSVAAVTRQQYLDDVTHNVGVTFLGQGLRCAQCHDHKFDPIPTRDYYRIQAVFAPVQFVDRDIPLQPGENVRGTGSTRAACTAHLTGDENTARRSDAKQKAAQSRNCSNSVASRTSMNCPTSSGTPLPG